MPALPSRQEAVVDELRQRWEDLWQREIGPQVLLLLVPPGWGTSSVFGRVTEIMGSGNTAPVTTVIPIQGRELLDEKGLQAEGIRRLLSDESGWHRIAELLDVDRPAGLVQLAVQVSGVLVPGGPTVGAGILLADRAIGVLRKQRESSAAGQAETVARAARAVSRVSARVPVIVLIDDAERLDVDLAVALLENLTFRADGQLLAVMALQRRSDLAKALQAGERPALAGLVHTLEADTDMSYTARAETARERCPGLPESTIRRIGQRTQTFCDVLKVTALKERLAEIGPGAGQSEVSSVVDALIETLHRGEPWEPSVEAVMVAWAGGVVHARQVAAALAAPV